MKKHVAWVLSRNHRKYTFLALGILCLVYVWISSTDDACQTKSCEDNVIKFNQINFVNKRTKKLLLWTKFFSWNWKGSVANAADNSKFNCSVTSDRSELGTADAVIFHFLDLWFWEAVPELRRPDQVWVLYNMEAPPHLHFTGLPWIRAFNWTMSYRTDATIHNPYSEIIPLTREEEARATATYKNKDFTINKTKMAVAVISDCVDDAQRYRYIRELAKYVDIDYFGACGNLTCPVSPVAECNSHKYRFRIAFENAKCKDYVTEKFWNSLKQETVPIVNWISDQSVFLRSSYINIHDFKNAKELGKYLNMLRTNKKLYNQYFSWKTKFKFNTNNMHGFKYLCDALHTPREAQTIIDPRKWLKTDTCRMWSIKEVLRRHLDRILFNLSW